jgi:hypothetical protein
MHEQRAPRAFRNAVPEAKSNVHLSNLISSLLEFQHQSATFTGISQSCATSSSLLGTCYTSTRSHFEDAAIRVAALWRSNRDKGIVEYLQL